ncbi:hypothetical protein TNCV_1076071 [Trichonephila clavipes]|nr:hypothetical protein TNCV_1076071 [Trichonephila clavipes]
MPEVLFGELTFFTTNAAALRKASMRVSKPTVLEKIIGSNSRDAQLTVPNDPRYSRLETNLRIGKANEG